MNTAFDSFSWHDAQLKELLVDRRDAGARDVVQVLVAWPEGGESEFVFHDCYAMTANMHFGVIATESIAIASLIADDEGLRSVRERWRPLGVSLEELRCYCLSCLRLEVKYESTLSVLKLSLALRRSDA